MAFRAGLALYRPQTQRRRTTPTWPSKWSAPFSEEDLASKYSGERPTNWTDGPELRASSQTICEFDRLIGTRGFISRLPLHLSLAALAFGGAGAGRDFLNIWRQGRQLRSTSAGVECAVSRLSIRSIPSFRNTSRPLTGRMAFRGRGLHDPGRVKSSTDSRCPYVGSF